ncbi:hypothetical protein C0992_008821, partial [Termitomyces sp. T32_za158]
MTTSLISRWLEDLQLHRPGEIILSSLNSRLHVPHTRSDFLSTRITMIEAMDDSLIMNSSLTTLLMLAEHADRFQATYGWETEWKKSSIYAYNSPLYPTSSSEAAILVPSVNPRNPKDLTLNENSVSVITSHTTFLRVPIDNPDLHFACLRDIVLAFDFPLLHKRLPLTALRRIVTQGLLSKLRPRLALQPISLEQASNLDALLAHKIHRYLGFPFRFPARLLFLPISDRGFGFTSISALNNAHAVAGLYRDLNHHQPAFKNIAAVSLADWTCQYNYCNNPLHPPGIHSGHTAQYRFLPHAWITAQAALRAQNLHIVPTDTSDILMGQIGLLHLFRASKFLLPLCVEQSTLTASFFNSCSRLGFHYLHSVGHWVYDSPHSLPTHFQPIPCPTTATPSMALHWSHLQSWLRNLPTLILHVSFPDSDLLLPRLLRQQLWETYISKLTTTSSTLLPCDFPKTLCASDASLTNTAGQPRVTCAVIHGQNAFVGSLREFESSASILRGEAYAMVLAHIISLYNDQANANDQINTLFSDHLSSVKFLNSDPLSSPLSLIQQPCRSLYRWLQSLSQRLKDQQQCLSVQHVKAHTSSNSLPAQMNRIVDHIATTSQTSLFPPPSLP